MLQGGDPLGTGKGGECIWGGHLEDEFHPDLRHGTYLHSFHCCTNEIDFDFDFDSYALFKK